MPSVAEPIPFKQIQPLILGAIFNKDDQSDFISQGMTRNSGECVAV